FQSSDPRVVGKGRGLTSTHQDGEPDLKPDVHRSAWESGLEDLDRLPFSRREAEAIVALVPGGQSLKAIDFDASRATVLNDEMAQYRIIHFATHGLLN